jgi:hypothetical protein
VPWFKVDDGFWGHPKRLACSSNAIGLWVVAGSWSAQQMTDGHIPRHVLAVLGGKPKDAAALVTAGLWETTPNGWHFHDWTEQQPTRAETEARRAEDAERKRLARAAKAEKRAAEAARRTASGECPPGHDTDADRTPRGRPPDVRPESALPDPTRPDPTRPGGTDVPPTTSGGGGAAPPAQPDTDNPISQVVAAYVDGARHAGQPIPAQTLRKRIGRQARELLPGTDLDALLRAAHGCGASGWNDLAVQLQRDAAGRRNGHAVGYSDPDRTGPAQALTADQWQAESASR